MIHWLYAEFTKISTAIIWLTQLIVHWEDIIDRFAGWLKLGHLIERRRNTMSIVQTVELLVGIVPKIEKIVADAEAVEQTPQVSQLIADLKAVIAEVKGDINPTPAITPTTPAP